MEEKNDQRLRRVAAFEQAVYAAETESEEDAFQAIRDFKSLKKKVLCGPHVLVFCGCLRCFRACFMSFFP